MLACIIGIVLMGFTVFAALPPGSYGLGWGGDIVLFLRGSVPVFAAFIGLVSVLIGIADIKDRCDAKKEEAAMEAQTKNQKS